MKPLDRPAEPDPSGRSAADLNAACIRALYAALERHDAVAATACFADDAAFEDIGFRLKGRPAIGRMWDMVCSAKDFRAEHDPADIGSDAVSGTGIWIAHYAPLMAGSKAAEVRNRSVSTFRFRTPGTISSQTDDADPRAWADMAFAYPVSVLVGNVEFVRRLLAGAKLAFHRPRKP
ncbi:MAG: nuclear transport factor 2 family protein [Amaricoccus sp.]|uniref:nuclear transport factor 2 family protein n=1 Tax=Amaricoccus sp. TaxID=1872485 RepID=UPI0033163C01